MVGRDWQKVSSMASHCWSPCGHEPNQPPELHCEGPWLISEDTVSFLLLLWLWRFYTVDSINKCHSNTVICRKFIFYDVLVNFVAPVLYTSLVGERWWPLHFSLTVFPSAIFFPSSLFSCYFSCSQLCIFYPTNLYFLFFNQQQREYSPPNDIYSNLSPRGIKRCWGCYICC